ncbi:AMP-binding protein [Actinocatenispora sera]|uniref:Acyl-CoA synthetase n=1 Tax=Actinocatenispora sera TaxID=390989 RepID=A0A810L5F8_9ACTN|nr:AMP-binding protein [Actinocatenispora sera]BCJ29571.1 acyl-CoA synthetase [Actinocatenispora sera]
MSETTLAGLTRRAHERYAAAPALLTPAGWWGFAELGAAARRTAYRLARLGLRPGDRVLLALANSAVLMVCEHALFGSGVVRVAVSERLHPREIAGIAADCAAALVICEDGAAAAVRALVAPAPPGTGTPAGHRDGEPPAKGGPGAAGGARGPVVLTADEAAELAAPGVPDRWPDWPLPGVDDLAALMYTSGSTGQPKGAMVSQRGWVAMLRGFWTALPPLGPGDVAVHAAPMSHFGGSVGTAVALRGGASVPVRRFDAGSVLDTVARHRATVLPSVPTILKALTEAAAGRTDLGSLRAIPYGGSGISAPAAARAHQAFGAVLYQCYGLSEALAPVTVLDARDHAAGGDRLASAGRPTPEVELRIVPVEPDPPTGPPAGAEPGANPGPPDAPAASGVDGVVGEVWLRGACVLPGYWDRPAATAAARTADGWFRTGDIGRIDAAGYLYLVDRISDVIVSGGFTVYPSEVERAIAELPEVADVVVFGIPHERWGEAVAALVVPGAGTRLSTADVVQACRDRLASYKKPLQVEIAAALPTSSTGKVARRALRAAAWARHERHVGE